MSYVVFARKWRPQTFDAIVGQDHIAKTLKNAIKNNRVAHAYMFTGPRGIGKTSAARIFAKALNCEKGPIPDPCNKCISCQGISGSRSLDVLEIDGASNRGIDEIRNLRENIKFAPTGGKSKIYIIDEVHMLTQEAFNALLKTLEEPPAHVKFIFATTQPNKVPLTILSRCQRFDFRKISTEEIVKKLSFISKEEGLKITEEALFSIARAADGGMRDAESILDQLSSFSDKKIAAPDVTHILGTLNEEALFLMTEAVIEKDAPKALEMVNNLVKEGKDMALVASELLAHFRNLLIAKVGKDLKTLIELPDDSIAKLSKQSEYFTIEDLLYTLNILSNTRNTIKRSNLGRIPLEMAVVKLTRRESIKSLGEIIDKISDIGERIGREPTSNPHPKPIVKKEIKIPVKKEEVKQAPLPKQEHDIKTKIALRQVEDVWPNLIKAIKQKKMSIASYLLEGEITSCDKSTVTLGFLAGHSFHKEILEESQNKKFVEDILSQMLGRTAALKFMTIEERRTPNGVATEEDLEDEVLPEESDFAAEHKKDPAINSALQIFKGKIVNNKKHKD